MTYTVFLLSLACPCVSRMWEGVVLERNKNEKKEIYWQDGKQRKLCVFNMQIEVLTLKEGNLKGESVVVAILPSCMEVSYCTSGFFS